MSFLWRSLIVIVSWLVATSTDATGLRDGRLTEVVHDVRTAEPGGKLATTTSNSIFRNGSIHTGPESRAELTFGDRTVVRLGDKTELRVEADSRTFDLESGAILTQVPAGVGRTILKVRGINATATGATLAVECLPEAYNKFISLDGTSRLCLKKSIWATDCVLLRAGQMIIVGPSPKSLPDAVDVDLNRLIDTCQFITAFPKLPGQERLVRAAAAQRKQKSHGAFVDTNLVIFGRGTVVSKEKTAPSPGSTKKKGAPAAFSRKDEIPDR